jgi:hypothetical protein
LTPLDDELRGVLDTLGDRYHRLCLVVGSSGDSRELSRSAAAAGWPVLNVGLEVGEALLGLSRRQRMLRIGQLLNDRVSANDGDPTVLTNIELLFAKDLAIDPLRVLQGLSRKRRMIVLWPGAADGRTVTYAEPGHPEHRQYSDPDVVLVGTTSPLAE